MGKQHKEKEDFNLVQLHKGIEIVEGNDVFRHFVLYNLRIVGKNELGRRTPACSKADGTVLVNKSVSLPPKHWAYAIAHCILHNCFGHYDLDKVPGYIEEDASGNKVKKARFNKKLWNVACDIYVDRFLHDIKHGEALNQSPVGTIPFSIMEDENKIYEYLLREHWDEDNHIYGVGAMDSMDMVGLDAPIEYGINRWGEQEKNEFAADFAYYLAKSVSGAINYVADHENDDSFGRQIAGWFINAFPLLGAIAASFKIVDDIEECRKYDISIAAVDAYEGIIYINTSKNLSENEWRFIMAHEFLHAALLHHSGLNWNYRCIRHGIRLDSLDVSLGIGFSVMDETLVSLYIIDDLFKCLWKQYKALAHRPQGVRVEDGWQELRVPEYYLCTKSETGTMYLYRKKQF